MSLKYTQLKVFHFKEKLDSLPRQVAEIRAPVHIRIKPTNVCNHNCRYCAYRVDRLQLGQDMVIRDSIPKEKMLEIVRDVSEMGVRAVTFSGGGDPFCYKHLAETARALSETEVRFAALTNGARLEGEAAAVFAHAATWLRISIDGWDSESYAAYRGVNASEFGRVMKNIEAFKRLGGGCYLGVSIITDKQNATHLHELVGKLKNAGVDSVKIAPCVVSNSGAENNTYHAEIFDVVKDQVTRARGDFETDAFEIFDSYHTQLESFKKSYDWCPYLQVLPVIGADQNVYACQDKAYNLEQGFIGSIKKVSFRDFWFADKSKFFRIDPREHCNHHCVADRKNKMVLEYLAANCEHLGFV